MITVDCATCSNIDGAVETAKLCAVKTRILPGRLLKDIRAASIAEVVYNAR